MDIEIRPAVADDADAMLAILPRLATPDLPPSRNPEDLWMSDAERLKQWRDGDVEHVRIQVATADGTVAGLAMVSLRPEPLTGDPSAHLEALAVADGYEGLGIGRRLIHAAEQDAARQGAKSMTLHVLTENERARALYERAGFDTELVRYIKPLDE